MGAPLPESWQSEGSSQTSPVAPAPGVQAARPSHAGAEQRPSSEKKLKHTAASAQIASSPQSSPSLQSVAPSLSSSAALLHSSGGAGAHSPSSQASPRSQSS